MASWVLRRDLSSASINILDAGAEAFTFQVVGRKSFPQEGDTVIFSRGNGEDIVFTAVALVSTSSLAGEDESITATITLGPVRSFDATRSVQYFRYSLVSVRKPDESSRGFRRVLRKIPDEDATTVSGGRIFFSRDVFYTLFRTLNERVRIAAHAFSVAATGRDLFGLRFAGRSQLLLKFLDQQVLPAARQLTAAAEAYERISSVQKPPFRELSLLAEDDDGTTLYERPIGPFQRPAARIVSATASIQSELSVVAAAMAQIDESTNIEARFERLTWTEPN